ncbi:hypothetical protein AB0M79_14240 [Polymorphospora sp. NPDC051019]|uniref:hypothetical protein n=1 Tax=Polymorphospora sp. NPDC051019 TaxID=3155725 RepID=UPI0034409253
MTPAGRAPRPANRAAVPRVAVGLLLTAGMTGAATSAPAAPVPPAVVSAALATPLAGGLRAGSAAPDSGTARRTEVTVSIAPAPTTPGPTPTGPEPTPTGTPGPVPTGTPAPPTPSASPDPGGRLPQTGLAIGGILVLGAALVGAGAGLRTLSRRR